MRLYCAVLYSSMVSAPHLSRTLWVGVLAKYCIVLQSVNTILKLSLGSTMWFLGFKSSGSTVSS